MLTWQGPCGFSIDASVHIQGDEPIAGHGPAALGVADHEVVHPLDGTITQDPVAPAESLRRGSRARIRWAVLLAPVHDVLPLLCSACGADMRIRAFLTDPPVVSTILVHLDLPHRPPPIAPSPATQLPGSMSADEWQRSTRTRV